MQKKTFLRNMEKAVLMGLIFSIIISFANFDTACEDLRENVLRLHIIANSDSKEDQKVKLQVRDSILKNSEKLFKNCADLSEAEENADSHLGDFKNIADKVLSQNGFDYKSTAKLSKSFFDTRNYPDFTLPAGTYNSLTVTLGNGKGHNWWCVIYPSVCLGSSSKKLKTVAGKKGYQIAVHHKKYKIKFKAIEILEKLKKKSRA